MTSKLLSTDHLQIPEALTLDHEALRAELLRAAAEPGAIGHAAERVAELCDAHFATEEQNICRAFGLLHDLASDRVRPEMAALAQSIARISTQHGADQHESIVAAIEKLLEEAQKQEHKEIADLVYRLRNHEKIENQVMYPKVLRTARSIQAIVESSL